MPDFLIIQFVNTTICDLPTLDQQEADLEEAIAANIHREWEQQTRDLDRAFFNANFRDN